MRDPLRIGAKGQEILCSATTLQVLFGYANACGYRVRITAESPADLFAFA